MTVVNVADSGVSELIDHVVVAKAIPVVDVKTNAKCAITLESVHNVYVRVKFVKIPFVSYAQIIVLRVNQMLCVVYVLVCAHCNVELPSARNAYKNATIVVH